MKAIRIYELWMDIYPFVKHEKRSHKVCEHINVPYVEEEGSLAICEYTQDVLINCLVCNQIYTVRIKIN